MSDELKLTLPERKQPARGGSKAVVALLILVLAVGVANIMLSLISPKGTGGTSSPATLSEKDQKDLALKLEKQGITAQAITAWRDYLALASVDRKEQSAIWYRMGKLHQEDGNEAEALACYYRSESEGIGADLESDLNRRIQECLEKLGKYAALRYELANRVTIDKIGEAPGDEVLAEIGAQKITKADLDRIIETEIDRQLSQYASFLPDDARNKQKEELLKRLSSTEQRMQVLQQYVAEEILYRRARELNLADDKDVRALLDDVERKLLAQQVVDRELADNIKITQSDVETYYEAHKADFVRPERARISDIVVDSEEKAQAAIDRLKQGEAFDALAKELSMDPASKDAGGEIKEWVEKGKPIPGIGTSEEAELAIFSAQPGSNLEAPIKSEQGYHVIRVREHEAERQLPLSEAKDDVYRALRSQKESEVREKLLTDLQKKYDVVIHNAQFAPEEAKESHATQ